MNRKKEASDAYFKALATAAYNQKIAMTLVEAAYMLAFQLGEEQFKIIWPVLPSRTGKQRAARVQAATMLYRDVKARCVSAQVLGTRTAFFAFLMLPSGQTITQVNMSNLLDVLPQLNKHQLTNGIQ